MVNNDPFGSWFEALERRHLETLTFSEVRRSVQALSSLYVERRNRLNAGSPFAGAGKRAAFALFFAPLHFLLVREIIRALKPSLPSGTAILDFGCGTGAAGAAWALEMGHPPKLIGVDLNSWALGECQWNYRQLGLHGTTKQADLKSFQIPTGTSVIAAFTLNELDTQARDRFGDVVMKSQRGAFPVLVVEPIARKLTSWWEEWKNLTVAAGGQSDEWRFRVELPERLALMDRAAGLDHHELTGRSLWLPGA